MVSAWLVGVVTAESAPRFSRGDGMSETLAVGCLRSEMSKTGNGVGLCWPSRPLGAAGELPPWGKPSTALPSRYERARCRVTRRERKHTRNMPDR